MNIYIHIYIYIYMNIYIHIHTHKQAILLIREHEASYKALCGALEQGKSVGDAILAIEVGEYIYIFVYPYV
jgi:hypothetical protein